MEWKLVKDDLHRLRQELAERSTRLGKLRAKHETLLAKHGQSAEEQDKSEVQCSIGPHPLSCTVCLIHQPLLPTQQHSCSEVVPQRFMLSAQRMFTVTPMFAAAWHLMQPTRSKGI